MENSYSLKASYLNTDVQTSELLGNFINGDTAAFSKLYNLHVNLLYNYGCKLTTDVELLKDCIQEVFIKIYNKRTELDTVANFKSYIIISLKNKLCDESRKRVNLSDVAVEELDVVSSDNIEKDYIDNEKELLDNAFVTKILDQLSPRQRKAIVLYYIEEKKYEEICTIMDMNYQSVRNLIHRGISKMRACAL
ncbi:MAG: RNA polymerase sigma factor [Paludibacter sp.]|nr:RNA polymerase sigma factor [Paludibacter sp.]